MKTVKNDLNLFKAYKSGPGKAARSSARGMVAIILLFILLVGAGYAVPYLLQMQAEQQAAEIRADLAVPEVAQLQEKLNQSVNKHALLMAYLEVLNHAQEGFSQSNLIDSALFDLLARAMPPDASIRNLEVNARSLQMTCICADPLAPAKLVQELRKTEAFSSITYNGVVKSDDGVYTFSMNCLFDWTWANRDKGEEGGNR